MYATGKNSNGETIVVNVTRCATMTHVLLLGCLLAISACSVAPVPKRSDIPARFPEQFAGSSTIASNNRPLWKQSFPSDRLQADIQTLLGENFELEAARARVEQAAAVYRIARSELFPSLDASADFGRTQILDDRATDTTRDNIAFGAALNWELDIWGRLRARKKAASLSLEEQQALADQTALDLQTLLVESWITHHAAHKLEQVLVEQRETNTRFLYLTELRFVHGQGNALDVLQQRGRLLTGERALPAVTARKRRAANAYAVLMGHFPDGGNLQQEEEWFTFDRLSALPTPRNLISDRPDLRAAFLALQAADQEVAAAIADRLPRLSIGSTYVASGNSLSTIGDEKVLRFASGLLTPVFDAGRLKAAAARRKAEARESLADLEQAMLVAVREVEEALVREHALFNEQILLRKEIAITLDTVDKSTLRYVNGMESYLPVLAALVKLQDLQHNEVRHEGVVKAVLPQIDPETRQKQALIEFGAERVSLGAYASLTLPGPSLKSVVVLPKEALRPGSTVWVLSESSTLEIRKVKIHAQDMLNVAIGEGLTGHDLVILSHIASPSQGMKLRMTTPITEGLQSSVGSEEQGE